MKKKFALPIIGILCLALIGIGILASDLDTRLAQAEEEVRWAQTALDTRLGGTWPGVGLDWGPPEEFGWEVEEKEPPSLETLPLYISIPIYFVPECAAKEGFFWVSVEEMGPSEGGVFYIEFRSDKDFEFTVHPDGTGTWELKPYLDE